ncbi:unnamed protein product [Cuscuta campestris]|uniref:Late embryogenesis abundant protein LEA-2 subgroup domain-containing protein n=1 Tax=Cuscuta campestris TaxID=132261 RepID=A0A484LN36_9ASTE|nr:unnamed protein product [Cuscuta campestris]
MAGSNDRRNARVGILIVSVVLGIIIYAIVQSTVDDENEEKRKPRPQYSVTSAALSPEATVAGNLLTADFRFTLKAHNPNRKKTIFYGNSTKVTLDDCEGFSEITSSPLPLVGPSTLLPGNDSTGIAVNLPVQNWPLPEDTASCGMILTMEFRAGFNQEEEELKRPRIEGRGGRGTASGRGGRGGGRTPSGGSSAPGRGSGRGIGSATGGANAATNSNALGLTPDQMTRLLSMLDVSSSDKDTGSNGEASAREWLIDSGASHHMTGNISFLTDVVPMAPCVITLPNGTQTTADVAVCGSHPK